MPYSKAHKLIGEVIGNKKYLDLSHPERFSFYRGQLAFAWQIAVVTEYPHMQILNDLIDSLDKEQQIAKDKEKYNAKG